MSDLFVANTHTPMLFFSSRGIAYKMKVWRLPEGTPQSKGKALVNMLPLEQGETITTVMPLPEDESTWDRLFVMFATASGNVRRNNLSDFVSINRNGKIAMKLDEGDSLIGVKVCTDEEDVLLATRIGMCIRFSVTDVRVFKGRDSTGVRGIRLAEGDRVISISILHHLSADAAERAAYLKAANALRRAEGEETDGEDSIELPEQLELSPERFEELAAAEEMILTISEEGFGKRSSAYGYRLTGRGGKGIWAMEMGDRNTAIAACFPVADNQQIVLVTDGGQIMRCPVDDVRIAARKTLGVTVFRVAADERVVSVAAVPGEENGEDAGVEIGEPGNGEENATTVTGQGDGVAT